MFTGFRHLVAALLQPPAHPLSDSPADSLPAADWHTANWPNLLCSPMDARHYAMQDWTQPFDAPPGAVADYRHG